MPASRKRRSTGPDITKSSYWGQVDLVAVRSIVAEHQVCYLAFLTVQGAHRPILRMCTPRCIQHDRETKRRAQFNINLYDLWLQ
jgi:hypothetical protein